MRQAHSIPCRLVTWLIPQNSMMTILTTGYSPNRAWPAYLIGQDGPYWQHLPFKVRSACSTNPHSVWIRELSCCYAVKLDFEASGCSTDGTAWTALGGDGRLPHSAFLFQRRRRPHDLFAWIPIFPQAFIIALCSRQQSTANKRRNKFWIGLNSARSEYRFQPRCADAPACQSNALSASQ